LIDAAEKAIIMVACHDNGFFVVITLKRSKVL